MTISWGFGNKWRAGTSVIWGIFPWCFRLFLSNKNKCEVSLTCYCQVWTRSPSVVTVCLEYTVYSILQTFSGCWTLTILWNKKNFGKCARSNWLWAWGTSNLVTLRVAVYSSVCVSVYVYRGNASELNVKGKLKKGRLYLKGNLALQRKKPQL